MLSHHSHHANLRGGTLDAVDVQGYLHNHETSPSHHQEFRNRSNKLMGNARQKPVSQRMCFHHESDSWRFELRRSDTSHVRS